MVQIERVPKLSHPHITAAYYAQFISTASVDSSRTSISEGDRWFLFTGLETHRLQKANTAMYDRCFFMLSSMVLSRQRVLT
jgi:hypothetical protein